MGGSAWIAPLPVTSETPRNGAVHFECVKLLVEENANIDAQTGNGWTSVMTASYAQKPDQFFGFESTHCLFYFCKPLTQSFEN